MSHPLVDELHAANVTLGAGQLVHRKIVHRDEGQRITSVDEVTLEPVDVIRAALAILGEIVSAIGGMYPDDQDAAQVATLTFCELAEPYCDADGWAKLDKMARTVAGNLADRGVRVQPPYTPAQRAKVRA